MLGSNGESGRACPSQGLSGNAVGLPHSTGCSMLDDLPAVSLLHIAFSMLRYVVSQPNLLTIVTMKGCCI